CTGIAGPSCYTRTDYTRGLSRRDRELSQFNQGSGDRSQQAGDFCLNRLGAASKSLEEDTIILTSRAKVRMLVSSATGEFDEDAEVTPAQWLRLRQPVRVQQ